MISDHILIPVVARSDTALVPEKAHRDDAAFDLYADIPPFENIAGGDPCPGYVRIPPGERALISTGISIALPDDYAALVLPRSGLALKHGITVANSPGLIDPGYRGEIGVTLLNTNHRDRNSFGEFVNEPFEVRAGDRIAQLLLIRLTDATLTLTLDQALSESERGVGGFGSTGLREIALPAREVIES